MKGLAPTEAARILNVHPQTIRRWLKEKKLRGWLVGGRYRIEPASVDQMVTPFGSDVQGRTGSKGVWIS